jgi:hypothetical protein
MVEVICDHGVGDRPVSRNPTIGREIASRAVDDCLQLFKFYLAGHAMSETLPSPFAIESGNEEKRLYF